MATACPGDLAGRRDRALLLLMAAGLGRLALVGLDVERLRLPRGLLDSLHLGTLMPVGAIHPIGFARADVQADERSF